MLYFVIFFVLILLLIIFFVKKDYKKKPNAKNTIINLSSDTSPTSTTDSTSLNKEIPPFGQKIGNYSVINQIGAGGMGIIMKASDSEGKPVALKIIKSEHINNKSLIDRFQQEMDISSRLNHENIASILGWGVDNLGRHFFAMEFVDGKNVRDLLESNAINLNLALDIFKQLCEGLKYAHSKNIIHRDIKPENIILNKDKVLKIVDFGIARIDDNKSLSLTMTNVSMGSPIYMSPEQKSDFSNVDARTDIYAAGTLFYEMLSGDMPGGLLRIDLIPKHLRAMVEKTIAYKAEDRYSSIDELLIDIDIYSKDQDIVDDQIAISKIGEHVKLREALINSFYKKISNTLPGLEIESFYIPAEGIGGNYYDCIEIDDSHTGILVGNLFDHIDVESSIFLSMLRAAFKIFAADSKSPKETFEKLNDFMSQDNFNNFAVLSYLVFNKERKEISVTTAGYRPVKLLKKNQNEFIDLQLDCLAIAIIDDYKYEEKILKVDSGDLLILSSAGAGKTVNLKGDSLGDEKLSKLVIENRDNSPKVLADKIKHTILKYGAGTALQDDITFMVIKIN